MTNIITNTLEGIIKETPVKQGRTGYYKVFFHPVKDKNRPRYYGSVTLDTAIKLYGDDEEFKAGVYRLKTRLTKDHNGKQQYFIDDIIYLRDIENNDDTCKTNDDYDKFYFTVVSVDNSTFIFHSTYTRQGVTPQLMTATRVPKEILRGVEPGGKYMCIRPYTDAGTKVWLWSSMEYDVGDPEKRKWKWDHGKLDVPTVEDNLKDLLDF